MPQSADLADLLLQAGRLGHSPESLAAVADALDARLDACSRNKVAEIAEALGRDPHTLPGAVRDAADPQTRLQAARLLAANEGGCACSGEAPPEPTFEQEEQAAESLARRALAAPEWLVNAGLL